MSLICTPAIPARAREAKRTFARASSPSASRASAGSPVIALCMGFSQPNSPTACMRSPSTPMPQASDDDELSPGFLRTVPFTLGPREAEVAAERLGLRTALKGRLIARHAAPLAAFTLTLSFASILALCGLIGRRAGEATILLAAAAFMVQRAIARWRIRRA